MKSHGGYGGSTGWSDHFPRLQKLWAAALSIVFALTNASEPTPRRDKSWFDITHKRQKYYLKYEFLLTNFILLENPRATNIIYIKKAKPILSECEHRFQLVRCVNSLIPNAELNARTFLSFGVKKFDEMELRSLSINLINLVQKTTQRLPDREIQADAVEITSGNEKLPLPSKRRGGMADKSHNGILLSAWALSLIIQERILVR